MAAILKVTDEPGRPALTLLVDVGNLTTMTIDVPRSIYGTPAMDAMINLAVEHARNPEGIRYATKRRGGERI